MTFWIIVPFLVLLASGFVILPLLRADKANAVKDGSALDKNGASGPVAQRRVPLGLALCLAAGVAVSALAVYAFVGRPDLASVTSRAGTLMGASTAQDATPANSMIGMIDQLREKVRQNPKDAEAWQTLGWAYMHIRQPASAVDAYKHAFALAPDNAEMRSALAEATIQSGSGKISDATLADLKAVVATDPADARAKFYMALYKDQHGDHKGAIADWIVLLKSAPENAAWVPEIRQVVEQVAKEQHIDVSADLPPQPAATANASDMPPGPNAEQVAAARQMSASDRGGMIQGMVDKLAVELKQNPRNADGWLRLIRARMVLGEKPLALAAYHDARAAFVGDPAQLSTIDSAARALGVAGG
jgi:cytochrome c-type biogenesis protein CcmH